jgi:hypothetical protein
MQESYSVPEVILEEAEESFLQLLPAKCREHYEKVFSECNEWKEKRGVMTLNEEVSDLTLYFSLSYEWTNVIMEWAYPSSFRRSLLYLDNPYQQMSSFQGYWGLPPQLLHW